VNVEQLIRKLEAMPRNAEVELSIGDYVKPSAGARKLGAMTTMVRPGGSVDVSPDQAQIVVVIYSADSHLAPNKGV
jgi:hypothetical protein